jgi:hypothetical protein
MIADHMQGLEKFESGLWKIADNLRANSNLAQARLGTVQRLDLALLIDGCHPADAAADDEDTLS